VYSIKKVLTEYYIKYSVNIYNSIEKYAVLLYNYNNIMQYLIMKGNIMRSKIPHLIQQLSDSLKNGSFGKSGEYFLSVKMLATEYDVSTESAFKIMNALAKQRLIRLKGKHYYITTGHVLPQTPYGTLLAASRRKSFGMIVNRIESPFFSAIIRELSIAAEEIGYFLHVLCNDNTPEREARMIDELLELGVCGIFTNAGISPEIRNIYSTCPLPLVSIGRNLGLANSDTVLVDNENAGKQVADHLLNCGCRYFAYVGLTKYLHEDPRLRGYTEHLRNNGIHIEEDHILSAEHNKDGKGDIESVASQLDKILHRLPVGEKLGIFCYHDLLAVAVMQRVRHYSHRSARSYHIPVDVAVVGFDDLPIAETITPSLTTIHYRYRSIVEQSLSMMMDYVQNSEHIPKSYIIPSSLFIRDSTVSNVFSSNAR